MKNCPNCGAECSPEVKYCPSCGHSLDFSIPEQGVGSQPPNLPYPIPFENRAAGGFWNTLWETWKLASLKPNIFYPAVGKSTDTSSAIWFYIVVGVVGIFINFFCGLPFRAYDIVLMMSKMGALYGGHVAHLTGLAVVFLLLASLVVAPVFLLFWFFITAGLTHIFLLMVKGAPLGFAVTLRSLAYVSAPNIIPCFGWLWSSILSIFALAEAHQTEVWRPVVALALEFFVCCGAVMVPAAIFFAYLYHNLH